MNCLELLSNFLLLSRYLGSFNNLFIAAKLPLEIDSGLDLQLKRGLSLQGFPSTYIVLAAQEQYAYLLHFPI